MTLLKADNRSVEKTKCSFTARQRLILGRLDLPEMDIG